MLATATVQIEKKTKAAISVHSSVDSRSEGTVDQESDGQYVAVLKAKRYAVKFDPPCVFLEYEDANAKRRVRAVKLSSILPETDPDKLTRKVIRSFPRRLDATSVKYDQVRKLIVKLLDHVQQQAKTGDSKAGSKSDVGRSAPPRPPPGAGQPKLSPLGLHGMPPLMPALSPKLPPDSPSLSPMSPYGNGLGYVHGGGGHGALNRMSVESADRFSTSTADEASSSLEGPLQGLAGLRDQARRGGGGGGDEDDDLETALNALERELGDDTDTRQAYALSSVASLSALRGSGSTPDMQHPPWRQGSAEEPLSRETSFSIADHTLNSFTSSGLAAAVRSAVGVSSSVASSVSSTGSEAVGAAASGAAGGGGGGGAAQVGGPQSKSRFAQEAERLVMELEVSGDTDLNKVTEVELQMAKAHMETTYLQNQVKPGDPDYVYDKQIEFGPPTETNDWDESEDEDEGNDEDSSVKQAGTQDSSSSSTVGATTTAAAATTKTTTISTSPAAQAAKPAVAPPAPAAAPASAITAASKPAAVAQAVGAKQGGEDVAAAARSGSTVSELVESDAESVEDSEELVDGGPGDSDSLEWP
uniref:Centrosomal protein of 19 kDa n=1 Tax=Chlamydomonas chlamydogama TaxID=225041 RepID=A0A7S2QU88_9CHLO|mmetsp:Transcript_562/g.1249  ORF Transcript_562/g.1249 Transcript_562/m.1249 type:complete len:586 (+) Transcript_562:183-1940(+)|eukprot:CAMPEP_0202899624 /NCGR_PEP_ID=MMETSP1392-20130828/7808_1 /ASSEMBLY_ACC=CAM_ASM_000868 /TAXON_ID=225041 /ORGANISM="Chlamydomonas chlamydogama, Strain SAG 11-48b" /LENGTH=585 /DNA_ID=CAMNT_0049585855 /DNA_START=162 /DNA_END=1919 /DNA_ORIENTATION=+